MQSIVKCSSVLLRAVFKKKRLKTLKGQLLKRILISILIVLYVNCFVFRFFVTDSANKIIYIWINICKYSKIAIRTKRTSLPFKCFNCRLFRDYSV